MAELPGELLEELRHLNPRVKGLVAELQRARRYGVRTRIVGVVVTGLLIVCGFRLSTVTSCAADNRANARQIALWEPFLTPGTPDQTPEERETTEKFKAVLRGTFPQQDCSFVPGL